MDVDYLVFDISTIFRDLGERWSLVYSPYGAVDISILGCMMRRFLRVSRFLYLDACFPYRLDA